jgi:transposase-like protein
MDCPKCKKGEYVKAGFVKNQQRYKCKICGYYYSVEKKSDVKTEETRRLALEMYLEGLSFRAIGRLLRISFGTVYQWIKKWDKMKGLPVNIYYSDHWNSYNEFVPAEKLVQIKAETFTVEGYNSRIRHYLARF